LYVPEEILVLLSTEDSAVKPLVSVLVIETVPAVLEYSIELYSTGEVEVRVVSLYVFEIGAVD
jgi:hypothetical protein